jgi:hypothetical protein
VAHTELMPRSLLYAFFKAWLILLYCYAVYCTVRVYVLFILLLPPQWLDSTTTT